MFVLGRPIDIDPLVSSAEILARMEPQLTLDELMGQFADLYTPLTAWGKSVMGNIAVAAFGDYFIGADSAGNYSQPLQGQNARLVGHFKSVCSVYLKKPIVVSHNSPTSVVPALEFRFTNANMVGEDLLIQQEYRSVAVPLLGQSPAIFEIAYISSVSN